MQMFDKIKIKCKNRLKAFRKHFYGLNFPIYCKVHGSKTPDRQGAIAQCATGDRLQLVHVPQKKHPFNMFVYNVELNRVMGFIKHSFAKKLVKTFGKGTCLDAMIENITGGTPFEYFGCNIRVFETQSMMADTEDFSHLYGN